MKYNFNDLKEEIKLAIDEKLKGSELLKNEGGFIFVVDGFTKIPIQDDLSTASTPYSPCIPAVTIVGKKTGLLYFFPLKLLLPELDV